MSISRSEWLRRRETACQPQRPAVIESTEVTARPDGGFDVVIQGEHLPVTAIPMSIHIGGRRVRQAIVRDRNRIEGVVDDASEGDDVTIDLNPTQRVAMRVERVR